MVLPEVATIIPSLKEQGRLFGCHDLAQGFRMPDPLVDVAHLTPPPVSHFP